MLSDRQMRLLNPAPRRLSGRGWLYSGVALVLFAIVAVVVGAIYLSEGGVTITGGLQPPNNSGVIAEVRPMAMDPVTNTASVRLVFTEFGNRYISTGSGVLTRTVRISVSTTDGVQEFIYPAGSHLGQAQVMLGTYGEVWLYQFDRYEANFTVAAEQVQRQPDATWRVQSSIPVGMQTQGGLPGWDISGTMPTGMAASASGDLAYSRAFTTKLFAILMLAMMALLSITVLAVALLTFSGRRRLEVALMSWMGAILFALPVLRSSLPNAPPIGAGIDILIFMWVLVFAIIAMLLMAVTWIRVRRLQLLASSTQDDDFT